MRHTGSLTSVMNYDSAKRGLNNAVLFYAPAGKQVGTTLIKQMHAASKLLEALEISRAQWIHSVNAEKCLAAIAEAKGQL